MEQVCKNVISRPLSVIILAGGTKNLARARNKRKVRRSFWYYPLWALTQLGLFVYRIIFGPKQVSEVILAKTEVKGWDIQLGNQRCVDRIVAACRAAGCIGEKGKIVLVADLDAGVTIAGVDVVVPAGATIGESLRNGGRALQGKGVTSVVAICGDAPLLTGAAIDRFYGQCRDHLNAQLHIGYISKELSLQQYPRLPHTWAKLWNGRSHEYYCSASIVMISLSWLEQISRRLDEFFAIRKDILRMAWQIGLLDLFLYCLGQYSLEQLQQKIGKIFGVRCAGICVEDAALGFNIDDQETYQLAQEYCALIA